MIERVWVDIPDESSLMIDGRWVGESIRDADGKWPWTYTDGDVIRRGLEDTRELAKASIMKEVGK